MASAELPVLLFELGDPLLEVGVMGFASIARVLCCDAVAVCASLFSRLRGELRTWALPGRTFD
jgi:hypothetical protein